MGGSDQFWQTYLESLERILFDGGILMIPLSLLSLAIYGLAFALIGSFRVHRFFRTDRERLREWVDHPERARGEIAVILRYARDDGVARPEDIANRFIEIRSVYLASIDSRRVLLLRLIMVAPLMGLLGTVMGMLTTFSGLAAATAGRTVDHVAEGISQALITTQTGLVIAIPGYFLASYIQKHRHQMASCLTALETLLVQRMRRGEMRS